MNAPEVASWIGSAVSLYSLHEYGRLRLLGPVSGLAAFLPWTYIAVSQDLHGMIISNFVFAAIHCRNLYRWFRKRADS